MTHIKGRKPFFLTFKNKCMSNVIKERISVHNIKKTVGELYGLPTSVFTVRKRKYATEAKRMVCWLMYFYTDMSLHKIAEEVSIDHASVLYMVRRLNGLIETSYEDAMKVVDAENKMVYLGLVKCNRVHRDCCLEEIRYPRSYKSPSRRPIPTTRKAEQILLASNDKRILESFLRKRREEINQCEDIDVVIRLAKEIKHMESALQHIK